MLISNMILERNVTKVIKLFLTPSLDLIECTRSGYQLSNSLIDKYYAR